MYFCSKHEIHLHSFLLATFSFFFLLVLISESRSTNIFFQNLERRIFWTPCFKTNFHCDHFRSSKSYVKNVNFIFFLCYTISQSLSSNPFLMFRTFFNWNFSGDLQLMLQTLALIGSKTSFPPTSRRLRLKAPSTRFQDNWDYAK